MTIGRQTEKSIRLTCFSEPTISRTSPDVTESSSSSTSAHQLIPSSYLFKTEAIEVCSNNYNYSYTLI